MPIFITHINTTVITYHFYVLVNPINGDEFYLGVTVDPKERLAQHFRRSRSQTLKQNASGLYIRALADVGLKPEMKVIEVMDCFSNDTLRASAHEKDLIRQYRKEGKAWCNDKRIR